MDSWVGTLIKAGMLSPLRFYSVRERCHANTPYNWSEDGSNLVRELRASCEASQIYFRSMEVSHVFNLFVFWGVVLLMIEMLPKTGTDEGKGDLYLSQISLSLWSPVNLDQNIQDAFCQNKTFTCEYQSCDWFIRVYGLVIVFMPCARSPTVWRKVFLFSRTVNISGNDLISS